MADNVQKILERSIPELEDLQERGLFNEKEIRAVRISVAIMNIDSKEGERP